MESGPLLAFECTYTQTHTLNLTNPAGPDSHLVPSVVVFCRTHTQPYATVNVLALAGALFFLCHNFEYNIMFLLLLTSR